MLPICWYQGMTIILMIGSIRSSMYSYKWSQSRSDPIHDLNVKVPYSVKRHLQYYELIWVNKTFLYCILYLALFPSIGSYYCWAGAVSIIGANRAGIFLSLIPLWSTAMAIFFFNEIFQLYHAIGSTLVIIGLFLANKKIHHVKN